MRMDDFDYIVVGAGSAGCVLASRLTEDGKSRVLLLEFGGSDRSVLIQMPAALSIPMNMPKYNWGFVTQPEPHLGGRQLATPRGKVLGVRPRSTGWFGCAATRSISTAGRNRAPRAGAIAMCCPICRADAHEGGDPQYRGNDGPLYNRYGCLDNPLHHAWLEAARQAGYPATPDYNGYQQEGFGRMAMSVHRGRRWSTANAYLRPALRRGNLRVLTHARATRVLFSDGRAVGVAYRRGGEERHVYTVREVILAGGSINSPQLLKLSGVGPAEELRALGIEVVQELPGVGENLQDHLEFYFQVECREPITLYSAMSSLAKAWIAVRWLLRHDGPGATNHFETGGFVRSRAGVHYPDLQYHFLPARSDL
jgi:choline dehydrogenase